MDPIVQATLDRIEGRVSAFVGDSMAEQAIGRSKGGLTTKIYARCDPLGNPTGFHLTPGQAHDLESSDVLLPGVLQKIEALLADKAFDAKERVLDLLKQAGVEIVIPPKSNRIEQRKYDEELYRNRHYDRKFLRQAQAVQRHRHALR